MLFLCCSMWGYPMMYDYLLALVVGLFYHQWTLNISHNRPLFPSWSEYHLTSFLLASSSLLIIFSNSYNIIGLLFYSMQCWSSHQFITSLIYGIRIIYRWLLKSNIYHFSGILWWWISHNWILEPNTLFLEKSWWIICGCHSIRCWGIWMNLDDSWFF